MNSDPWLYRWLPLIKERAGAGVVLELGCGHGDDTAALVGAGHEVLAIDVSAPAVAEAQSRVAAEFHCQDIRAPFPVQLDRVGVVVASLSLHYFSWPETVALVERVRGTLRSNGILLCRLNSTNDHNYGASGHVPIADNYYSVNGKPKRFVDRKSIDELFAHGWHALAIEEFVIQRYVYPKAVWEVVLERDA